MATAAEGTGASPQPAAAPPRPRPIAGLLAGMAAGLAASGAATLFEAKTRKTGDGVSETDPASRLVRYAIGAAVGGLYGVLAEYRTTATSDFDGAYGAATAALLDEAAAPAVRPAATPGETPSPMRGREIVSHLVYGTVLEGVRTLLAGRR